MDGWRTNVEKRCGKVVDIMVLELVELESGYLFFFKVGS